MLGPQAFLALEYAACQKRSRRPGNKTCALMDQDDKYKEPISLHYMHSGVNTKKIIRYSVATEYLPGPFITSIFSFQNIFGFWKAKKKGREVRKCIREYLLIAEERGEA